MDTERFLSSAACRALMERVMTMQAGGGQVAVHVRSIWRGSLRWARNTVLSTGDTTVQEIAITRSRQGKRGRAFTNRTDDAALADCVRRAEQILVFDKPSYYSDHDMRPRESYATPALWSEDTFRVDAAARALLHRQLVAPVEAARLLSAGYVEIAAIGNGVANSEGLFAYVPETRAEYSITIRNAQGTASGWAGKDHQDWRQLDARDLSAIALEKCQRSAGAVAIEPGRYTVILEPQAMADLLFPMVESFDDWPKAIMGGGPWANRVPDAVAPDILVGDGAVNVAQIGHGETQNATRVGQRVIDSRVTLSADPADPDVPFVPFFQDGTPMRPVTWIENGVLRKLSYNRWFALGNFNRPDPLNNSLGIRMSGGTTTVPEMIASTERGLLVTRFVNVRLVDLDSVLCTGQTSDGLWLIERGKVTAPVKNFRFRESPVFALNNLQALGRPTRVFMPQPTMVPPVKIQDFSMTSLSDAV